VVTPVRTTALRIRAAFDAVGIKGALHVEDLADSASEVNVDAGQRMPLASLVKLHVAVAVARAIDAGTLSPTGRVRVGVRRTRGPTGLAAMRDPVSMSIRDLVFLMLSVSDNAACDALFDAVGADAVAAVTDDLGLRGTVIRGRLRDLLESIPHDLGADPEDVAVALARPGALQALRALDPGRTTGGTARDLTRLLRMVWRDEAASPQACAELRRTLGLQVWPHRLAAGFPEDDVVVSGKTGTLPGFRAEAGVIELPSDRAYAVAVLTRSDQLALNHPRVDATIGTTARMAVMALEDAHVRS
jgi:beta-lactamase class A